MKQPTIYIILFIVIIQFSCKKDFLKNPGKDVIVEQTYVVDLQTTNDYLNGIYVTLSKTFFQYSTQIYPDLVADNIKLKTASSTLLNIQYNWNMTSYSASTNMNLVWSVGYQAIRSCSFVIKKSEEYKTENPAWAGDMKAQALALRALAYFNMVNVFAQPYSFTADASHPGIPYITTDDWTVPVYDRGTVAQGYTEMVDDLNTAIPLFRGGTQNKLYMNRDAAKALLARVYLFKSDFQNASKWAVEVSNSVPIMPTGTNGYPSKLFTTGETEALFQFPPSIAGLATPSGNYTAQYFTAYQGTYFITAKNFIATADIANILNAYSGDLRKNWVQGSDLTIAKYPVSTDPAYASRASGFYYNTILRSSEMYLTASESFAQLNKEDSARYYLNQVRTRANIPAVTNAITGSALQDSIYLERRRELAFEGLRMFDLLRLKKGVNRIDAWNPAKAVLPFPSDKAIAPIPLNDVNIYGLKQNPSY